MLFKGNEIDIKTIRKGKVRSARAVQAADTVEHLIRLKHNSGSNPWPVIEAVCNIWADSNPGLYRSFLYELSEIKQTRRTKKADSRGGGLRYTLDIPEKVQFMIRMIYSADELPMNKEFFHEWARRFPKMKISESN